MVPASAAAASRGSARIFARGCVAIRNAARSSVATGVAYVRVSTAAVLAAWYRQQVPGRELIAEANQRLFGDGWWVKPATLAAQRMGDVSLDVAQQEFQMGQIRLLTRRVYWVAGWTTTNEILAKLLLGAAKLMGRGDDSAVLMWARYAEGVEGLGDAARHLESFGEARAARLLQTFDEARLAGR